MKDAYQTPVYTTEARFREEVFTAQLKSKHTWWVPLGGYCNNCMRRLVAHVCISRGWNVLEVYVVRHLL